MSSAVSKANMEDNMSNLTNLPGFSYAQAAKGRAAAPSPQPTLGAAATGSTPTQTKEVTHPAANSITPPTSVTEVESVTSAATLHSDPPTAMPADGSATATTKDAMITSAPTETLPGSRVTEKAVSVADSQSQNGDRRSSSPKLRSRSTEHGDGKKGRKGKKSKGSDAGSANEQVQEKEQETAVKPELSEAPIPTVNPWFKHGDRKAGVSPTPAPPAANEAATTTGDRSVDTRDDGKKTANTEAASSPGVNRPLIGNGKSQRKTNDVARLNGEAVARRSGPRGSRLDREQKGLVNGILSPAGDITSWPTPESAAGTDDGKQKKSEKHESSEKDEQEDSSQGKPRQKKEWINIDFTPSVAFNTPIPQRKSQPRSGVRGGREASGRGAPAGSAGTTHERTSTGVSGKTNIDRPREGGPPSRANPQAPMASKRHPTDNTSTRQQGKPSAPPDRNKEGQDSMRGDHARNGRSENAEQHNPRALSKSETREGYPSKEQSYNSQNRADGRSGRGRGTYRGGHSHQASAQSALSSMNGPIHANSNGGPARPSDHYSPPLQSNAFGPPYRGGRGPRGGHYGQNGPARNPSGHRPTPVVTNMGSYDYGMLPPTMTPTPFWPPHTEILPMVQNQIEYYLSLENLLKDEFLRKRMDSQGFVPLDLVCSFNRMKQLLANANEVVLFEACAGSQKLDFVVDEHQVRKLRGRETGTQFVLPVDQREPEAASGGPQQMTWLSHDKRSDGYGVNHFIPAAMSSPPPYGPHFNHGANGQVFSPYMTNYHGDGVSGGASNHQGYQEQTQLSAKAPGFSPAGNAWDGPLNRNVSNSQANGMMSGYQNGTATPASNASNGDVTFRPAESQAFDQDEATGMHGVNPLPSDRATVTSQ